MKFDVVTFGSAFHDIYITSEDFMLHKSDAGVLLCEEYGKKVIVKDRISTTGGGATNAAVCFERLGVQSAIVACVGGGHWGRMVSNQLQEEGVSLIYLQKTHMHPTSSSIALVGKDGGRTVLVHRAASNKLSWRHVDWKRLNGRWAYVSSLGGDLDLLGKIMRWAKEKDVKIAFNPGGSEIKKRREVSKYLKNVEVLILNKQEMLRFVGKKETEKIEKDDVLSLGAEKVLVTDGKHGCHVYTQEGHVFAQAAVKTEAVEETGAGDSFGSTFVAGLIKEVGMRKALRMAAINSSHVVRKIGPKEGLLFWPEMQRALE